MTEATMKKSNGGEETLTQKEEYLPTDPIEGEAAYVGVSAGATINLGNFSSGKINVSITYPCNPSEVDSVYPKLKDWVDGRVEKEVAQLREYAPKSKSVDI